MKILKILNHSKIGFREPLNEMAGSDEIEGELSCFQKHEIRLRERLVIQWDVEGE